MQLLRILHRVHFNKRLGRFQSLAFKPDNANPNVSVISTDCIESLGNTKCQHIKRFYSSPGPASNPAIFWLFESGSLPGNTTLNQSDSITGDSCHYDILGLNPKDARQLFLSYIIPHEDIRICSNDG